MSYQNYKLKVFQIIVHLYSLVEFQHDNWKSEIQILLNLSCRIVFVWFVFIKWKESESPMVEWRLYNHLYLYFCLIGFLSFLVDEPDQTFTTFPDYLRRRNLSGSITLCLNLFSFHGYSVFFWFAFSQKHEWLTEQVWFHLISQINIKTLNLNPRVQFCLLKCGWIAFHKAIKCYSFNLFLLCFLNQKVLRCNTYDWNN